MSNPGGRTGDAPHDAGANERRLLVETDDDRPWTDQLGPVYREVDVAPLLGVSQQAVAADPHLLRLQMRDGSLGYPVFQFDQGRQLPGIRAVIEILGSVVATPWTIASWLTSPHTGLNGARPLAALRDGRNEQVVAAARRLARALAA